MRFETLTSLKAKHFSLSKLLHADSHRAGDPVSGTVFKPSEAKPLWPQREASDATATASLSAKSLQPRPPLNPDKIRVDGPPHGGVQYETISVIKDGRPDPERHGLLPGPQLPLRHVRETAGRPTSQHHHHYHPLLAINNPGGTAGDVVTASDNEEEE
ncbi:unnamed protein product [Pleuronectes platessa]|uniref:Uncharacterized protein n=1 Tax=Pleuronectes platessa TaxID=8262 RepID=A0A9N7W228_PLEPL|nr:unnamed protein product [Pleuronectes platessa]